MKLKLLDNSLIPNQLSYQDNLKQIERWGSMFLDHAITCFLTIPILLLVETYFATLGKIGLVLIFTLYMNKDLLNGKSLAKRITGQTVIDIQTKNPASELKCMIRNLAMIIWPLEVLVVFISPNKRIGDIIAGTKVVRTKKENIKSFYEDVSRKKIESYIFPIIIALVFNWITLFFLFDWVTQLLFLFYES